jgi:predicted nuclease with TOPRIM domain
MDYRLVEDLFDRLERIERKVEDLHQEVQNMAVDQTTFDTELAGLVSAITQLSTAVDALIASKGGVDLTAEEASVQSASATVAAELAKVNPTPPVVPPVPPVV